MIKLVDETVGQLRQQIEQNGLTNRVNMIVVSDHGIVTLHSLTLVYSLV